VGKYRKRTGVHRHEPVDSGDLQAATGCLRRSGQSAHPPVPAHLLTHLKQGPQSTAVQESDTAQNQDQMIPGRPGPACEGLQLAGGHQIQLPAHRDHYDALETVARERELTHPSTIAAASKTGGSHCGGYAGCLVTDDAPGCSRPRRRDVDLPAATAGCAWRLPLDGFQAVAGEVGSLLEADYASICRYDPGEMMCMVARWSAPGAADVGMPGFGGRWAMGDDSSAAAVLRTGRPAHRYSLRFLPVRQRRINHLRDVGQV
jgi:hypothetical protein